MAFGAGEVEFVAVDGFTAAAPTGLAGDGVAKNKNKYSETPKNKQALSWGVAVGEWFSINCTPNPL